MKPFVLFSTAVKWLPESERRKIYVACAREHASSPLSIDKTPYARRREAAEAEAAQAAEAEAAQVAQARQVAQAGAREAARVAALRTLKEKNEQQRRIAREAKEREKEAAKAAFEEYKRQQAAMQELMAQRQRAMLQEAAERQRQRTAGQGPQNHPGPSAPPRPPPATAAASAATSTAPFAEPGDVPTAALIKQVLRDRASAHLCLGVDFFAPRDVVRKRYLALVLRLHPDKVSHPRAAEAFAAVEAAFRRLCGG